LFFRKLFLAISVDLQEIGSRLHLSTFSKRFLGLDSLQGPQPTTNTKKRRLPFLGNNVWEKKCIIWNLKKYDFSVFTPKRWPIARFREYHLKEREKPYKRVKILQIFCQFFAKLL